MLRGTFLLLAVLSVCSGRGRAQDVPVQEVYFPGRPCHEFLCANEVCVSRRVVCNGVSECGDNSDELNCHGAPGNDNTQTSSRCSAHQFLCRDMTQCLYQGYRCDGEADCRDGSDEVNCQTGPTGCLQNQLRCGSGACVPVSYRCDNVADCDDGTDESGCYHPVNPGPPEPTEAPATATAEGRCNGHSNTVDHRNGHCLNCLHHTMGQRCETCIPGYTGDATQGTPHACTPVIHVCHCHGHSGHCDATGNCLNCQHNTVGSRCERCAEGYYGDPRYGNPDDCLPLSQGQGPTGHVQGQTDQNQPDQGQTGQNQPGQTSHGQPDQGQTNQGQPGQGQTDQSQGQTDQGQAGQGQQEELPYIVGDRCRCFNHATKCDPTSFKCLNCLHNTEGFYCHRCQPGFRGNALYGTPYDCQRIPLYSEGSSPGTTPAPAAAPAPTVRPHCYCHGHSDTCDESGRCLDCLHQTEGKHCSRCQAGYIGDARKGTAADCQLAHPDCSCHGHADFCDVFGRCLNCRHNTVGDQCENCVLGYYGDATRGTPSDCRRCPCPLTMPSNQFSDTCTLDIDGLPTCTRCHPGYLGRDCGTCANGYWGNPRVEGQRCVRQ
ncbi:basement membrane-specific heparan sulfate proteoglycan core protein-like [Branchiostoma lanceolatum]|uniref:basement membrane-specific heparan sulfate proteoglycan core protein-like n=1 Tax=Branchiostoma lanceolatum TaxID=7740 RepID=UPI0034547494